MKEILKKTGMWMLMALFLSYHVSTTSFYHTHHFSWGTVTHSHPYFPSGDNALNHNHTQNQCILIALLSHIVPAGMAIILLILVSVVVKRIYLPVRRYRSHERILPLLLRSPPKIIC